MSHHRPDLLTNDGRDIDDLARLRCSQCWHWVSRDRAIGECRAKSPTHAGWPTTSHWQGCGEFFARGSGVLMSLAVQTDIERDNRNLVDRAKQAFNAWLKEANVS